MEISKAYKFCPLCGGNLTLTSSHLLVCPQDHRTYINPRPAVAALITNDRGEVLLIKRKKEPRMGYWALPGGFVQPGESWDEALGREISEELQVSVAGGEFICALPHDYLYKELNYPILDLIFTAAIKSGEIAPNDEIEQVAYFSPTNLPGEMAFSSHQQALEIYINKKS